MAEELLDSASSSKSFEVKPTIGKTMSGVGFVVPETHDFLINMGKKPLNTLEKMIIGVIAFQILIFFFTSTPSWVYILLFAFWRASYNLGLGYLLRSQSKRTLIVKKFSPFFEKGTWTYDFLKRNFELKMGDDYDFEKVPVEYNCWLLFRSLVDLILLNDFVSYFICVFAFMNYPQSLDFLDVFRFILGISLCVFNWFIKVDALRVVKDFAWYWGDFFFLIDSELTFDGVFQMAPHPMYSIGYMGYYGMSLISGSYVVLYISLAAHFCQFLFLALVENPHIDKIYNTMVEEHPILKKQRAMLYEGPTAYFRRDLIVFKNFDIFRSADIFTIMILSSTVITYLMNLPTWFYIVQCIAWRLFHSLILGLVLKYQSKDKFFTKHYIKYGFTVQDAFSNWKSVYNLSLTMTHTTLFFCALQLYQAPETFFSGTFLLKHTLGVVLIGLHIWTSTEVYEVIGDFGWFYGDFFIQPPGTTPEYTGIYRFLNNPEKVMGHAGQYGMALIADNWIVFAIALFSQFMTFSFIHYVENVHMKKLYGSRVRKSSGLTSALSDKIKPYGIVRKVSKFTDKAEIQLESLKNEVKQPLEQLVDKAKTEFFPTLVDNLSETTTKIARPIVIRDIDSSQYEISCPTSATLGQSISVTWKAPEDHSERDWIGIYLISGKSSKEGMTISSSRGKWSLVGPGTSGVIRFSSDKLPWKPGTYEFRYHHDYGYAIVATSKPVVISLGDGLEELSVQKGITAEEIQKQLLVIWKRLLEKDEITINDSFKTFSGNETSTKRKALALMTFIKNVYGVEFSIEILDAYPSILLLSQKLQEGIEALIIIEAPFQSEELEDKKNQ